MEESTSLGVILRRVLEVRQERETALGGATPRIRSRIAAVEFEHGISSRPSNIERRTRACKSGVEHRMSNARGARPRGGASNVQGSNTASWAEASNVERRIRPPPLFETRTLFDEYPCSVRPAALSLASWLDRLTSVQPGIRFGPARHFASSGRPHCGPARVVCSRGRGRGRAS